MTRQELQKSEAIVVSKTITFSIVMLSDISVSYLRK